MPVSDNPGLARRDELASVVSHHYTPGSVYIPAVGCINQTLKQFGVGLSSRALSSISDNVRQVHAGTRTETASSLRESAVFTRDTLDALKAGRFGETLANATGVLMNATGSALYFANYDRERLSPQQRALYDAMHP
ncbi:hypothetical protein CJP72_07630 [Citrobacter sp. NCU1]|uniref:hypothetical protein n=1 Tax=Citrobacter sp. NCU1 TaxID=2026683 RepID=UPI001390FA90|nr:hypothetical protein [Citrobacter sp. NCU1]NDO80646.1 hypothetical protein [Citrobacter sp. NCU1]